MWYDDRERKWKRHPQCRCTDEHLKHSPCYCRGLQMLNAQGEPVSYPALDGLFVKPAAAEPEPQS